MREATHSCTKGVNSFPSRKNSSDIPLPVSSTTSSTTIWFGPSSTDVTGASATESLTYPFVVNLRAF